MEIKYILNGRPVSVDQEDKEFFEKNNPTAKIQSATSGGAEVDLNTGQVINQNKAETNQSQDKTPKQTFKPEHATKTQQYTFNNVDYFDVEFQDREDFLKNNPTASPALNINSDSKSIESKIANGTATEEEKAFYIDNYDKNYLVENNKDKKDPLQGKKDGGAWEDLYLSMNNGLARGFSVEQAFDLWHDGADISDEKLDELIAYANVLENQEQTHEALSYQKSIEEHGEGFWGGVKALAENPGYIPQFTVESLASMATTLYSEEAWATMLAQGSVWAGGAAVAGQLGPQVGMLEELVTVPGAFFAGAYGGLTTAMETGLTTIELLKEELGDQDFTNENVRKILEDEDAMWNIKSRAAARGLMVGNIETVAMLATGGIAGAATKTMPGAKKAIAQTAIQVVGEATGGFTSELGGQLGKGGETAFDMDPDAINMSEAVLEAAGFATDVVVGGGKSIYTSTKVAVNESKGNYKLNGEARTQADIVKIINNKNLSAADLAKLDINIKNDPVFKNLVDQMQGKATLETQIDPKITGKEDRKNLVDLEIQRSKAEADVKKTGIFSVPGAKTKLNNIVEKINEIITPYEAVDGRTSDVKAQKKEAADVKQKVGERIFKSNLEFAKKHSSMYGLEIDDNLTREQIRDKYGDEAANSDGFVKDNKIIINKDVASQTNAVNVGNHELLHGILRKEMKSDPNKFKDIRSQLKEQIGSQWSSVESRVEEAGYTEQYMKDNPDEWITLASDAIANGDITYSDSVFQPLMDFFLPVLRAAGFKKIKFDTGKDVFNFLKEYNRSIHKGTLSKGIVQATKPSEQTTETTDTKMSKSQNPKLDKLGKNFTNETWKSEGYNTAMETIEKDPFVRNIIRNKYKAPSKMPVTFVDDVINSPEFQNMVKRFNKDKWGTKNENESLFAYINSQMDFRTGDVYNRFKDQFEGKKVEADSVTPDGQQRVQFEDQDTSFDKIDEQDMSVRDRDIQDSTPEAKERKSTFRKEIGIKGIGKGRIFREVRKALRTSSTITNPKKFLQTYEKTLADSLFDMMKKIFPDTNTMEKYRMAILESIPVGKLKKMQKELPAKDNKGKNFGNIFVKNHGRQSSQEVLTDFMYGTNRTGKNPRKKKLLPEMKALWESGAKGLKPAEAKKNPEGAEYYKKKAAGVTIWERLNVDGTTWKSYIEGDFVGKRQEAKGSGTKGNNRIKILEQAAIAIGRDATPENLTTEFIEEYIAEKKLDGKMTVEEVREAISETIERPSDLKFAKSKPLNKKQSEQVGKDFNDATAKKMSSYDNQDILKKKKNKKGKWETDFDAIIQVGKTLREQTTGVLDRLKSSMTHRLKEIRKVTTKSRRGLMTNVGNFDSMVQYNEAIQDVMERFGYSEKGTRKLDSNRVRYNKKTKQLEFNTGTLKRKQNWVPAKKFVKDQYSKVDNLMDFLKEIKTHLDKHPNDRWFFVEIFKDTQNNMDAITRISAPLLGLPIDRNGNVVFNEEIIEEHMFVQSDIGKLFFHAYDNNLMPQLEQVLKSSYAQIALRQSDNKKIDQAKLGRSMGDIFYNEIIPRLLRGEIKIKDGMLSIVRYAIAGIDLNTYVLSETGQTVTEHFGLGIKNYNKLSKAHKEAVVKKQNELLVELFRGNITQDVAVKEIKQFSKIKYSKSPTEIKNINNTIDAFNKQAELIKKQNKAIQADLEKRGYKFSKTGDVEGQTPGEMIKIIQADLEAKGYTFVDMDNKGMSTFDFDETLIIDGENFVVATHPKTNEVVNVKSGDWPIKGPELAEQGFDFNFDDFVNVRGGVDGPLLQKMKNQIKKYGPENVFILTARPQSADVAIHEWLKSKGVNIPFKNITGLADSRGQAKADWMLEKFAEGYNDMYFVDDALPNVEAVKNVLEQLDIKSKVVQAKIKFSMTAGIEFNEILEQTKGVKAKKKFSSAEARNIGVGKGKNIFKNFFVPPSAEDFKGLLYAFIGRGEQGNTHAEFFKKKLLDPFAKASRDWSSYKQSMSDDYKALKKEFSNVKGILKKKVKGTSFTNEHATRVYLWDKAGYEIPGLSESQKNKLVETVEKTPELKSFAEGLGSISRIPEGYVQPNNYWVAESIASDLSNTVSKVGRKLFFAEWIENKNTIFSPENLNKIEAIYGTSFRDELEKILYRMETGQNRTTGKDAQVNMLLDWINGSVGAVMFFNMRSATLQTISMANFINMADNNPVAAAKAFANVPQYIKDFSYIFNSDMLKQRRAGLQIDVSASELTKAFYDGRSKPQAIIAYLLEKGFTPTQIADSFAIAAGGATFYRNRLSKLIKNGMSEAKAKEKAWLDFQEIAEETQQSSRPDLISNQQAGPLGRLILAWQNTPMQMTRLMKKKMSDFVNRRRTKGYSQFQSDMANISGIAYYGLIQNIYFGALQTGLMFMLFGWDDDEERKEKLEKRVANGALDSILRGTGIYGAAVSTLKNVLLKWKEEADKPGWKRENMNIAQEAVNLSPPLGTKMRKIMQAIRTEEWNKGVSKEIGLRIENPNLSIAANWIEALTNAPVARLINKANNVEEALTGNHKLWQRVALLAGWSKWSLGVEDEELEKAKIDAEEKRKVENKKEKEKEKEEKKKDNKKKGIKTVRCSGTNSRGNRCSLTTETKSKSWKCVHHKKFKDGGDADGDGIKEYQCTGKTSSGKRCRNKGEYTGKKKRCYAHQ